MASRSSDEGIVDGSCNLTVSYPDFNILKPGVNDEKRQCSLDILPLLFEDPSLSESLKYPLDGARSQDVFSISVTPQEKNNFQCASHMAFLRFSDVSNHAKDQNLSAESNCQNCIDLYTDSADSYSSCVVDMNLEKKSQQVAESYEKDLESSKTESVLIHLQRVLRRQASVSVGSKLVQLVMNYGSTSPKDKGGVERIYEAPNNHWKKYRRAASLDSRKIVLLFSILSIFGTLVLIYLTLKVRQQSGDVSIRV